MRTLGLCFASIVAVACDAALDRASSALTGTKENIVILAKDPVNLSDQPIAFGSSETMTVLGEWTSVCLVMRGNVPTTAQSQVDATLADALHGSSVRVQVDTTDGLRKILQPPMVGWRKSGVILAENELAACASASCDARLPIGATVRSIEVSASPALSAKGLYWWSQSDLLQPGKSSSAASAGEKRKNCG